MVLKTTYLKIFYHISSLELVTQLAVVLTNAYSRDDSEFRISPFYCDTLCFCEKSTPEANMLTLLPITSSHCFANSLIQP